MVSDPGRNLDPSEILGLGCGSMTFEVAEGGGVGSLFCISSRLGCMENSCLESLEVIMFRRIRSALLTGPGLVQ